MTMRLHRHQSQAHSARFTRLAVRYWLPTIAGSMLGLSLQFVTLQPSSAQSSSYNNSSTTESSSTWTEKDTRLATEYLSLLVEKPEDNRVLDLLWNLYEKHQQTNFLLQSIANQAAQQPHPNAILIHARLLQRAGRIEEAIERYQELLKLQPEHALALKALSELQQQNDPAAALAHLRKLTENLSSNDPQRPQLLLKQARQLLLLDRLEEAAKACEAALENPELTANNSALLREASQLLLSAGMIEKTIDLMQQLTAQATEPARKLDLLYDLSRLHEQVGHFEEAATALNQGLDLLHDKDWRYLQFFQRLVKLHERFDKLDVLKKKLLAAAEMKPVTERALSDLARYAEQIVDNEDRIKWLRELVKHFPENDTHRWDLVQALIDHNEASEAAELIDQRLKRDGSDRLQLIQLRALTHLHLTESEQAVFLLKQYLQQHAGDEEMEKQVLSFARQKSLDPLIEFILTERLKRNPGKSENLFELATFQRTRGNHKEVDQLFEEYLNSAPVTEQQRRLNDIANFLSSSPDLESAENAARAAAASPGAGRDEILRLADVLTQRSAFDEAKALLEKAWEISTTEEQRVDVDERLAAVLSGEPNAKLLTTPVEPTPEFTLPAMFSGEGFGAEVPKQKPPTIPEALTEYAQELSRKALHAACLPGYIIFQKILPFPWRHAFPELPPAEQVTPLRIQRAAWWSLRTGNADAAIVLLQSLSYQLAKQKQTAGLEHEKLLLEALLTKADQNPQIAIQQLYRVADLDPTNRTSYLLRIAELESRRQGKQGLRRAIAILEGVIKAEPEHDAALSALSQYYLENAQRDKALALWEEAARRSSGKNTPILERYGELLIAQRRFQDYLQAQMRLLEKQPDIKRRRDLFRNTLQRLMWVDAVQGELPENEKKERLGLIKNLLLQRARREPFEAFWNEALATIYEHEGDDQKAFAAMKQAYYTSPDTPFSLEQLRIAALRVGDLKSAIYFQKQIAAAATTSDKVSEWRQLIQLLESDFRMEEADLARRRIEARFSQDPSALEELANYYTETAQDDAARRVLEQLVKLRSWDAPRLLRLAMQQKKLNDLEAARETLIRLLDHIETPVEDPKIAKTPELWPWPIFSEIFPSPTSHSLAINGLEDIPGLEEKEIEHLRTFLSMPRYELVEIPSEPVPIRLRAIQELVTLQNFEGDLPQSVQSKLSVIESAWFHYHSGQNEPFGKLLQQSLQSSKKLEGRFLFAWLAFKSHNPELVFQWIKDAPSRDREPRSNLALSVLHFLCDDSNFQFTTKDVRAVGYSELFSNQSIIDLARKLENRRHFQLAMALAEAMSSRSSTLTARHLIALAQIAENCGDEVRQYAYYKKIWSLPLVSAANEFGDAFVQSFGRLWNMNPSPQERETLLRESLRRLNQFPPSAADDLRRSRLLAIAGVTKPSAEKIARILTSQLHASRPFAEPLMGRLPPGFNPGPRIDPMTHMRDYWTDLRQHEEQLRFDGLASLLPAIDNAAIQRNAGVSLGPRATFEFNSWRNHALLMQMRNTNHSGRVRLIEQVLESDDSFELLLDLGNFLENQAYSREAVHLFRRLVKRSPANEEYSLLLRRACSASGESIWASLYLEETIPAEIHYKPQGIDETLRAEHAQHLARLHHLPRLRQFAYQNPEANARVLPGRIPPRVPYLHELAKLLQRHKDLPGALAAWEELVRLWPKDIDANLQRARLLKQMGNPSRALEALREIPLGNFWNDPIREAFELRAELLAEAGLWDEMRELMNLVTGSARTSLQTGDPLSVTPYPPNTAIFFFGNTSFGAPTTTSSSSNPTYTGGVLILSKLLARHQRFSEAQSILLRAERSVRDDTERFRLRLEQLRLNAASPQWNPLSDLSRICACFRAFTDDGDSLKRLIGFLTEEANGPRAKEWVKILRHPHMPQHSVTSLALSIFARQLHENDLTNIVSAWQKEDPYRENARELTIEQLLKFGKPGWALQVAKAGPNGGLSQSALIIPIYHALGDRLAMETLFAQLVRTTFPGSSAVAPYAEAFSKVGRNDLARDLYQISIDRLHHTASYNPPLIESYVRFLIRQRRFEGAENLLVKEHHFLNEGLEALLVELYREWDKLDQLPEELAKYQLPPAVLHECLFLGGHKVPTPDWPLPKAWQNPEGANNTSSSPKVP